ncbi:MAG TPA: hypothetical protein VGL40_13410 [Bacillota bacterium]|jgi:hypothetical protein
MNEKDGDQRVIEDAARLIQRLGLITPAVLYGEAFKPLSWLGSQWVHFLGPMAAPVFGLDRVEAYGHLLEDRGNVERLLARLEALAAEEDATGRRQAPKQVPKQE